MAFVTIETGKAARATAIVTSFTYNKKSERGTLYVSVPSVIAGKNGWDKFDCCQVAIGTEEDAGKLLVTPAKEGQFKLGRLKHCVNLRIPEQRGWSGQNFKSKEVECTWSGAALVVTLPAELTAPQSLPFKSTRSAPVEEASHAGTPRAAPVSAPTNKPTLIGHTFSANGKSVRIPVGQCLTILSFLMKAYPNERPKAALVEFMGGGLTDGVTDASISSTIKRLNDVIKHCSMAVDLKKGAVQLCNELL